MNLDLKTIKLERSDNVACITLNRPDRVNAMGRIMLHEINLAMDEVEADPEVRSVVVTGSGDNFSSGFDLKEQVEKTVYGTKDWNRVLNQDFAAVMRFWACSKPTIAAVRGFCLAGACELAMACDITIAEENAKFGEPELKFGAGIVVMLLPWLVGPKAAKEIILTGMDQVSSADALRIGLINRVVPVGTSLQVAMTMAKNISVMDPMLVRETKRAINRTFDIMGLTQALESALDIDLRIESEGSPDKAKFLDIAKRDGLRAAFAWRDARFSVAEV